LNHIFNTKGDKEEGRKRIFKNRDANNIAYCSMWGNSNSPENILGRQGPTTSPDLLQSSASQGEAQNIKCPVCKMTLAICLGTLRSDEYRSRCDAQRSE
jgi:hypothetical protein